MDKPMPCLAQRVCTCSEDIPKEAFEKSCIACRTWYNRTTKGFYNA